MPNDAAGGANALVSCMTYSACSISMVLANKAVLSKYDFHFPVMLLFFQNSVALLCLFAAKKAMPNTVKFRSRFQSEVAMDWLPVNLLFCAMLMTGFLSLKALAVPMVTIFKNLTNVVILGGDWYFHGAQISAGIAASVFIMLGGAVFAARNDLEFDASGYLWMGLNCVATAAYVLYMNGKSKTVNLSKFGMVYYNNLLSLPICLPIAVMMGEFPALLDAPLLHGPDANGFMLCALFSGVVGFVLNLASLWCNQSVTATTYAVVGAMNKIPLLLLGAVLFTNAITSQQWLYISASMCGGFLYSYVKFKEKQREQQGKPILPTQSRP